MDINVHGKKVLIMGLGLHGGGVGTARFFADRGALLTITDMRTRDQLKISIAALSGYKEITYVLGRHRKSDFLRADLILKNPGVPPTSPYLTLARRKHIPITTDMGIFFRLCRATIIGVTGTRGKSTTCFLIFKFLEIFFARHRHKDNNQGRRVFLGGNIRTSIFDFADTLTSRDVVVLELSSFQLDDLERDTWYEAPFRRKSPHIAVFTNILRDHLNWHTDMKNYVSAKKVIFKHQAKDDILFANGSDPILKKITAHAPAKIVFPRLAKKFMPIINTNLGCHYRSSAALAIAVAEHFKVSPTVIASVLKKFKSLPGRQEYIARINGVHFINDTTATIPDASIAAIIRFRLLAKKNHLILIAGGSDKKLKFSEMARMITHSVDDLILLPGTATHQLLRELFKKRNKNKALEVKKAESMTHAVSMAVAAAKKGDYVLLSPGAASFGLFANEFERGDKFVAAVNSLK